eukprot:TRINITY_DN16137_c0_g1_i2.p2 TRINITY_DN16137_c0_g1~~TRINITY_DN16137_c0_g1_i2.p2  ORF type:complete len:208 (+),score=55.88 TRINITY_DN16137_c0_g1_i2:84-707(+)
MDRPRVQLSADTTAALTGQIDACGHPGYLSGFVCPVCCTHALGDAVFTACEHLFHRGCIERALRAKPQCPYCRAALPSGQPQFRAAPPAVRGMLAAAEAHCPQGCGEVLPFERLETHVRGACGSTPLRCGLRGCRVVCTRAAMAAHRAVCNHARIACGGCGEQVSRGALQRHAALKCARRPAGCAEGGGESSAEGCGSIPVCGSASG